MANGEFLEILSPSALADLQTLNTALTETVAKVTQINAMMSSAGTPSGNLAAITNLNKAYQDQTVIIQRLSARTSEEIVNQRILAQNADNVARANSNLVGSYQKLSIAYTNQKKLALDLGATYGLQSKQFTDAAAKANAMAQELKALDAQVGVNTRNVGNYGNAFTNALGTIYSKVRVLAYILPGIGIGGIFGLAIDPLMNYLKGLDFVQKAFGILTEEAKITQNAIENVGKAGAKNAVEEQTNVKLLLATAKDHTLTYQDRLIAVKELQKEYPYYFENLSTEQIMAGKTTEAENKLNDAILARAKSQAAVSKIAEVQALIIDKEIESDKIKSQLDANKLTLNARLREDQVRSTDDTRTRIAAAKGNVAMYQSELTAIRTQIKGYDDLNKSLLKYATINKEASIGLDYKEEKTKKPKAEKRPDDEVLGLIKIQKENDGLYGRLVKNKQALEDTQKLVSKNAAEWKEYEIQIQAVQLALDLLTGKETILDKDLQKTADAAGKEFERIYGHMAKMGTATKAASAEFNKYVGDFMNKAGFSQTFDLLFKQQKNGLTLFDEIFNKAGSTEDRTKAMFIAISGAAQDAFNLIEKSQVTNFENEKTRLGNQKDIALSFAGDSAAAKLKIEKEYQAQIREINRKEAIAKKETAMFNIAIDTAQAVMAVSAKAQWWEIPAMIALGALEEALVASQKLPSYYTGTDNAIGGWAHTDERGAEIHTDKYGNIKDFGSNQGARLKYLESGDKIFDAYATKKILNQAEFDGDLNRILSSRGINAPVIINNSITASQMDRMLAKHLASQPKIINNWDRNGFGSYISKNGNITRRSENRGSGLGISV